MTAPHPTLSPGLSTSAERAARCLDNLVIDAGAKLALIERIVAAMAEARREAFEESGSTPAVERWMHVFRLADGTYEIACRGPFMCKRPRPLPEVYGTLIARVLIEDPAPSAEETKP